MLRQYIQLFLVVQMVKNLPIRQETRVQSLSQEDPLEKGMATQSSILAWRTPGTEEAGGLESDVTESLTQWNQGLTTLGLPTP